MPSYPRNYPFYNWVPKWLGILILVLMFIPILTVGGVYSVNSTEMMSGLGIISEHITFTNFATSIGMWVLAQILRTVRIPEGNLNQTHESIHEDPPLLLRDIVKQ